MTGGGVIPTEPPSFSRSPLPRLRRGNGDRGNPVIKSIAFRLTLVLQLVIARLNPERRIIPPRRHFTALHQKQSTIRNSPSGPF